MGLKSREVLWSPADTPQCSQLQAWVLDGWGGRAVHLRHQRCLGFGQFFPCLRRRGEPSFFLRRARAGHVGDAAMAAADHCALRGSRRNCRQRRPAMRQRCPEPLRRASSSTSTVSKRCGSGGPLRARSLRSQCWRGAQHRRLPALERPRRVRAGRRARDHRCARRWPHGRGRPRRRGEPGSRRRSASASRSEQPGRSKKGGSRGGTRRFNVERAIASPCSPP